MDGLTNNPLFTADESDDDEKDRRLAMTSALPKVREKNLPLQTERLHKKKAAGRPGSQAVQGNKLFGSFDLSKLVGADEVAINMQQEAAGEAGGDLIMEGLEGERRKKQLDWEALLTTEPRRMDEERKKSVEKYQKDKLDEESKRYLQGMQFHKDIIQRTNHRPAAEEEEDEIEIEGESKYFLNKVKDAAVSAPDHLHTSLATAAGVPHGVFKRPAAPTPLIRDREDLRRVLKTTVVRRANLTEEDQKRLNVETNFTKEDENEESKQNLAEEARDEDYHPEVDAKIKEVEKMLLSDEEELEGGEGEDEDSEFGNGLLQVPEEDWNNESQIEQNEKNMRQESLSAREEGEQEDEDYLEGDSEEPQPHQDSHGDPDAAEDLEESVREEDAKILVRLKRQKDVKEAAREKKRARRAERMVKYAEEQKKRKRITRDNDIFDAEADLGEVVDGRDAGVAAIDVGSSQQPEDRQEREDDDSSADLEGLIAELDDIADNGNEDAAFKKYWADAMEADRELVKKIVKGGFKSSILLRQQQDVERDRQERVLSADQIRRLATLKKKLEEVKSLAVDHTNQEQKYKMLLGIEAEEIEGEMLLLQDKHEKSDSKPKKVRKPHRSRPPITRRRRSAGRLSWTDSKSLTPMRRRTDSRTGSPSSPPSTRSPRTSTSSR